MLTTDVDLARADGDQGLTVRATVVALDAAAAQFGNRRPAVADSWAATTCLAGGQGAIRSRTDYDRREECEHASDGLRTMVDDSSRGSLNDAP